MIWQLIVITMIGYLIGSINLSIILSKAMKKGDIREHGSGNAGTTNTLRVLGVWPAILVFIFDALKGVIAILVTRPIVWFGGVPIEQFELTYELAILLSAFGAILGHNFPIYYEFKGGKGVATSLGAILFIEPQIGLVCLLFGLVLIIASRMVSLGSISTAILYPVLVLLVGERFPGYPIPYFVFAFLLALLIIYRHRSNINRLMNGKENKLWKTKKEKAEEARNAQNEKNK